MSNIRFYPSPGHILLKITEEATGDLLVAQDPDKTPASQGEVIAVGKPVLHESGQLLETDVKAGDTIVFKPFGGVDLIYLNNIEHRIVPFGHIRGILK